MTSNIGIFGYLGSRDWAACWIRHWVDQRELNRPRSFYPFFLYFFFYLFIARGVLFGISKTSFQQRILASLGDIYDGRAFGLDWHRSGRIRLGGFLLESIHFFLAILPWLLLQHGSKTTIVAPCQDLERLRSGNSKEETRAMNHIAISDFF